MLNTMNSLRQSHWLRVLAFVAVFGSLAWYPVGTFANPLGEVVIHGDVSFARNGSTLDITQSTNRAIIQWDSFSIGSGETTNFNQISSSAAVLNRVMGGSQSLIDGILRANGNVFVINPNGIILGSNSRVDVGGLLLSTLDTPNDRFINGGDMTFSGNSAAPVSNFGTINAAGGNVFLFAQNVENHGYIGAVDGSVVMIGSNEVLLHAGGTGGNVSVSGTVGLGHVYNDNTLEGAKVDMRAVNNNAMAMAVQQKGTVRITGAEKRNGRVMLVAQGGAGLSQEGTINTGGGAVNMVSDGQIQIGGTTDASSTNAAGGNIEIIGREINVTPAGTLRSNGTSGGSVKLDGAEKLDFSGNVEAKGTSGLGGMTTLTGGEVMLRTGAVVDASGATGGGAIFVGGGFQGSNPNLRNAANTTVEEGVEIRANATSSGNGGLVTVWAQGSTEAHGNISVEGVGNGGFVEVSGLGSLGFGGNVNLQGGQGNGMLLLDPKNIHIGQINTDPATGVVSVGGFTGSGLNTIGYEYDNGGSGLGKLPAGVIDATALQTAWGSGNVVIHTAPAGVDPGEAGNVVIEPDVQIIGNTSNSFSIFAHGNIVVGGPSLDGVVQYTTTGGIRIGNAGVERGPIYLQNRGAGNVNLVAGWDPSALPGGNPFAGALFDFNSGANGAGGLVPNTQAMHFASSISATDILAGTYGLYGTQSGKGKIDINPDANSQIRIGSAGGETNLFGRTLVVKAGDQTDEYVHIGGYLDDQTIPGSLTGNVRVELTETAGDSLVVTGGGSTRGYVQFGHGSNGAITNPDAGSSLLGNVMINAGTGRMLLQAGRGGESYVIVGHGGRLLRNIMAPATNTAEDDGVQLMQGDISVNAGELVMIGRDSNSSNFVLIGHGGVAIDNMTSLDPVALANSLTTNANISVNVLENLRMVGGRQQAFAQIGSGGWQVRGNHTGSISVIAGGDIEMMAENPPTQAVNQSHVMIGFGGFDSDGAHIGDIFVQSGGMITMLGGGAYATAAGADDSFVQIGNGGRASSTDPNSTSISTYLAGTNPWNNVPPNNPSAPPPNPVLSSGGTITVLANGNIQMVGTDGGAQSYMQIGHGGDDADGTRFGNITVTSTHGAISLNSGGLDDDVNNGVNSPTQIGHGGRDASGDHSGNILVTAAGNISLQGGFENVGYSLIGHGGRYDGTFLGAVAGVTPTVTNFFNSDGGDLSGNIMVVSQNGAVSVRGGGSTTADMALGEINYAMIGHSLFDARPAFKATASGTITVNAATGVALQGGTRDGSFAAIGHGGANADEGTQIPANSGIIKNATFGMPGTSNILVSTSTGDITLRGGGYTGAGSAGSETFRYATIGHHGSNSDFDAYGDVTVQATLGNILLEGGSQRSSGAQIGHGGENLDGGRNTLNQPHILSGNITVDALNAITVRGGIGYSYADTLASPVTLATDRSYAMIGHGGVDLGNRNNNRTHLLSGDINVNTSILGRTVTVQGGDGSSNFAVIGHGGFEAGANQGNIFVKGSVDVRASQNVTVQGGDGISNNVGATNTSTLDSTGSADRYYRNEENFGQIGHFGIFNVGSGSVLTTQGGLASGSRMNINVSSGGNISLLAGMGRAADAMIGVGGNQNNLQPGSPSVFTVMNLDADVTVRSGGNVTLTGAGNGTSSFDKTVQAVHPGYSSFAQIGNGGAGVNSTATGNLGGDIRVFALGSVSLQSGAPVDNFLGRAAVITEFNNYAKIGNGDFQFDSGARGGENFRSGDIYVATGGDLLVVGGLIGHIDRQFSDAIGFNGDTYLAVDRTDSTGTAGGSLVTASMLLPNSGATLASNLKSNLLGQLRIYTPTRGQNRINQSTYINPLSAPYPTYDHPDVGGGLFSESGISLLRTADEYFSGSGYNDKNRTFSSASPIAAMPTLRDWAPWDSSDGVTFADFHDYYRADRNYTIYYSPAIIIPPRVNLPDGYPWGLKPDDRYDLDKGLRMSMHDLIKASSSRMAGVSSTYPVGAVEEELGALAGGATSYRPFEVFDWRTLMDWQSGGLTYVPGSGLIAPGKPSAPVNSGDGVPAAPQTGAGTGENKGGAFDFDFKGSSSGESQPGQPAPGAAPAGDAQPAPAMGEEPKAPETPAPTN